MSTHISFPPEPTRELIRGRAATPEDCERGQAAFAAKVPSPELANVPLPVFLPRVATVVAQDDARSVINIIQAELARMPEGLIVLGYEDENGDLGVCTSNEVEIWQAFFVFFYNPQINLDTLTDRFPKTFVRHGATLATRQFSDDDPILFVRYYFGEHVTKHAISVSAGSEHADAMSRCNSCFVVFFENLDHVLDEINTLIDAQFVLGDLTNGFLYLEWNGILQPAD